jgi:hypothetical protein
LKHPYVPGIVKTVAMTPSIAQFKRRDAEAELARFIASAKLSVASTSA